MSNIYQFIGFTLLFKNLVLVHRNPEGAPVEHSIIIGVLPPDYGNLGQTIPKGAYQGEEAEGKRKADSDSDYTVPIEKSLIFSIWILDSVAEPKQAAKA